MLYHKDWKIQALQKYERQNIVKCFFGETVTSIHQYTILINPQEEREREREREREERERERERERR